MNKRVTPAPAVRLNLDLTVGFSQEAWDHVHGGEWPLTPANALAYVMQMFEADAKGTGITTVEALDTEDLATGSPVEEDLI